MMTWAMLVIKAKEKGYTVSQEKLPTLQKDITYTQFAATRKSGYKVTGRTIEDIWKYITGGNHTPECFASISKRLEEMDTYADQHPNFCRKCGGWGGFLSTFDPSPAGISLAPGYLEDWDPCPDCLEQEICPRCGSLDVNLEEGNICPQCGFEEGKTEGMPLSPDECGCCGCRTEDY